MSRFMVLIYGDEARWDAASAEQSAEIDAGHRAFRAAATEDAIVASGQLESSRLAKRIGRHGDATLVTDGPFAEFKEVLGGYYEIEANSLDEAVTLASGLAEVRQDHSWVEVWPLVDHGA